MRTNDTLSDIQNSLVSVISPYSPIYRKIGFSSVDAGYVFLDIVRLRLPPQCGGSLPPGAGAPGLLNSACAAIAPGATAPDMRPSICRPGGKVLSEVPTCRTRYVKGMDPGPDIRPSKKPMLILISFKPYFVAEY